MLPSLFACTDLGQHDKVNLGWSLLLPEKGLMRNINPISLTDIIWAMFIGIVQVEENKYRTTKKNHLPETLELAFSLLADALSPEGEKAFL